MRGMVGLVGRSSGARRLSGSLARSWGAIAATGSRSQACGVAWPRTWAQAAAPGAEALPGNPARTWARAARPRRAGLSGRLPFLQRSVPAKESAPEGDLGSREAPLAVEHADGRPIAHCLAGLPGNPARHLRPHLANGRAHGGGGGADRAPVGRRGEGHALGASGHGPGPATSRRVAFLGPPPWVVFRKPWARTGRRHAGCGAQAGPQGL